jgi:hypothetical protein
MAYIRAICDERIKLNANECLINPNFLCSFLEIMSVIAEHIDLFTRKLTGTLRLQEGRRVFFKI